jgi:predicted HD phosphohydrolase
VRSLELQGGIFSKEEAEAFLRRPYAEDALRLRKWDDRAKEQNRATPDLDHYLSLVERVMRRHADARA